MSDGRYHFQIAQQFLKRGGRRLPAAELVPRKGCGHLLAVFQVATRHRHQILHRHLRGDLARAYLLLHAVRQKLDQS